MPAFVFFFQLLYPFAWVNDPLRATAAAAGGTILIRRRALQRIGGMAAVRGALIDDVALAAAVKRGGRIWLGHSALARSVRAYPTAADIWRMVSRTAYVQLRFSPLLLVGTVLAMTLTFLLPPFAALLRPRGGALVRLAGLGCDGRRLPAHIAPLPPLRVVGAVPAGGGSVLSRCHDRFRGQPSSRPRRRVEGSRLSGCRRMSGAATVEAWSGKDRGDENFPVGSLLIRRDLRAHVHAFYAFARNADDIADSPNLAAGEKIARLDVMEDVLLGRRDDGSPSALRLRASLAETGVTLAPFARSADRVPPRRDQAAVCGLGRIAATTAAIRRCRSGGMCSICMARIARHTCPRMRCARRCRC